MARITRLFLVGEYNLFRECLASMLSGFDRFDVVGQASSLDDVRSPFPAAEPEVLLIDVGPPEPAMIDSIKSFAEELPEVKLITLGLEEKEKEILPFIEAGAHAYVLKEASINELGQVVDQVLRGEAVCSPQIASKMFSRLADLARAKRRGERLQSLNLTPREIEILQLVADGLSNREIAGQLYLSFHTVKNHIHNILEKLKVQHRSQAVDYAYRMRWISRSRRHRTEPSRIL